MIRSRVSPVLRVLVALLLLGAAAAFPAPSAAAAPVPFVVCNQFGGQAGPDIAGPWVVWTDNRNGNLDIYGKDLDTGRQRAVCANKAQQDNPAVTRYLSPGGAIEYVAVWVDKRNHGGDPTDIYGRDLTTWREFAVSRSATVKWFPAVSGQWVAWIEADDPAGPYRVRVRDLAAARSYLIATSKVLSPVAIDWRMKGSERVVTVVYASGEGDIRGCDVPGGTPFVISARDTFEWMPDISHNRVVWWESGGRVMLRDLRTGARTFVHTGARPRVDHSLVAWDGGGHGGSFVIDYVAGAKVSVRDIARGTTVTLSVPHQTSLFPAVSGRRVVWEAGPAKRILSHIHIWGARLP